MVKRWVVNASPLIVLGKLSRLSMLGDLAESIVVPEAVVQEIDQGPDNDPAKLWLSGDGRDFVIETSPIEPSIANWDLGSGESHVLSYALINPGYEAILDDLAARKCADTFSIPIRGTLGILLLAKKEGRLKDIEPLLTELRDNGFHVASVVLEAIRRLAED